MSCAIVIAGASGVGKTTVANLILEKCDFSLVRSATTRPPREDGNYDEYLYLTREEFLSRVENGEMLEFTEYGDRLYGTPKSEIERIVSEGKIPLLIVDLSGVQSFSKKREEFSHKAFYLYEDINVIEKRLYDRELSQPSPDGLLNFFKRKQANITDFLRLPELADGFFAFVKNTEAKVAADAILDAFFERDAVSDPLVSKGDSLRQLAEKLSESAKAKI